MKVTFTISVILLCVLQLILSDDNSVDDHRYCFQFTWLRQENNKHPNNIQMNCSVSVPCIKPVIGDSTRPNITDMWNADNRSEISCPLVSGNVCIKYSYSYDNDIVNTTYFCGRMSEDEDVAINSGCYTQKVGIYIIEACACQSDSGQMPCNSSSGIHQLLIKIIVILIIILY